jgi:glucose/arabinose dehydrogenase
MKMAALGWISFGGRLALARTVETRGTAYREIAGGEGWLGTAATQELGAPVENDFVAVAERFLGTPYLWGGRTSLGLDCSALVQLALAAAGIKVMDLPAGPLNHHWTKNITASPDGRFLYVTVGSNSNVGENGMEKEEGRAAIWEYERATGKSRLFATGLRNPNGMAWEPKTKVLWTVVNERDELGDDLVPDYLTSVKDSAFYGWPYSYFGQHVDKRVKPQRPDLVAKAIVPDFALGPHTASLGLTYSSDNLLGAPFTNGMFVGQHGSWNRKPKSGYNVVFVPFAAGQPAGQPVEVLGGFVSPDGKAWGRPVGVAVDKRGALLVADDVGNTVWRVTASK